MKLQINANINPLWTTHCLHLTPLSTQTSLGHLALRNLYALYKQVVNEKVLLNVVIIISSIILTVHTETKKWKVS